MSAEVSVEAEAAGRSAEVLVEGQAVVLVEGQAVVSIEAGGWSFVEAAVGSEQSVP